MIEEKKSYILGMAKSALQVEKGSYDGIADDFIKKISPGPLRNLELDFLRLVYAAKELKSKVNIVFAYLMVTTYKVKEKVENWRRKYEVEDNLVHIICADLNIDEIKVLVEEKIKNRISNTTKSIDENDGAKANKGRNILEGRLKSHIEKTHRKVELINSINEKPFKIDWDYCRVIAGSNSFTS
jgi:hypothetical protein